MGAMLFLGALCISYIPALIVIALTIFPYGFITGLFLSSLFFQVLSFLISGLFWLAFMKINIQATYILTLIFYISITNTIRISMLHYYRDAKNSFMIIGSNSSIHPTHVYHFGYAQGLAWGLSEASLFFGYHILIHLTGITSNAVMFPDPMTPCGTFSSTYTPFPTILSTSIMWLCVFIVNTLLSFINILQHLHIKNQCLKFIIIVFNYCIHYGLYISLYVVSSYQYCTAILYVPPIYMGCTLLYTFLNYFFLHPQDPQSRLGKLSTEVNLVERIRSQRRQLHDQDYHRFDDDGDDHMNTNPTILSDINNTNDYNQQYQPINDEEDNTILSRRNNIQ